MSDFSKFGVQVGGAGGILQPKQNYRFQIAFFGFGVAGENTTKLVQNVVSCTKPAVKFEQIKVHSYNSQINVQSKPTWENITLRFRDDITNGTLKLIGQQLQKQFNFFEQTSAISGNDYKFRMEIQTLDGTHSAPLDVWNIEGCGIADFKYGTTHDYKESSIVEIELVISPDNCTLYNGTNENVTREGGQLFPELGVSTTTGSASGSFGDISGS